MATATERQEILNDLSTVAIGDLVSLWRRVSLVDTDFAEVMTAAFPELATSYAEVAASVAADWYTESAAAAALSYEAIPAATRPVEALTQSASWALGAEGEQALSRMSGSLQRTIFDGARDTIVLNVENTGSRWVRHAQPDACAFCRMLATRHSDRRSWYRSSRSALDVVGRSVNLTSADQRAIAAGQAATEELLERRESYSRGSRRGQGRVRAQRGSRAVGSTGYHDFCRCTAVEVHAGQEYAPPEYVQAWDDEYQKARANAGKSDMRSILAAWREQGAR